MSDVNELLIAPLQKFSKDSMHLIKKCTKPDRKGEFGSFLVARAPHQLRLVPTCGYHTAPSTTVHSVGVSLRDCSFPESLWYRSRVVEAIPTGFRNVTKCLARTWFSLTAL